MLNDFSDALSALMADDPGLVIQTDGNRPQVLVGLWFDAATGREYVCAFAGTFAEAHAIAVKRRADKLASAEVEIEVRREVEARMQAAA